MFRIPAGGKGIGRIVLNQEDPGFGNTGMLGQFHDHLMDIRVFLRWNFFGPVHSQNNLMGKPVTPEIHDPGQKKGHDHTALAPNGMIWVAYHKGTSPVKTDINRDSIWAYARTIGMDAVAQVSINDDWSAVRLKRA